MTRERRWPSTFRLVGEYDKRPDAALVHYTVGGPYYNEYIDCDYSRDGMLSCTPREGKS